MTSKTLYGVTFQYGIDQSLDPSDAKQVVDTKAVLAELIGMFLFVVVGCGAACAHGASDGATRLNVALAFGMGIMVLAYSIGHHSGGHINCAVTLSLVVGQHVHWMQGLANLLAQLLGSVLGAVFLLIIFPCEADMTTNLGTNIASKDYGTGSILLGETIGTFLLCFVVWETAVSPSASCGKNACIAIGFAVFLAHVLLLPVDGCSINPTRSFGPAVVSSMRGCSNYSPGGLQDLWKFWMGPLIGGAAAGCVQRIFKPKVEDPISEVLLEDTKVERVANEKDCILVGAERGKPCDDDELTVATESISDKDDRKWFAWSKDKKQGGAKAARSACLNLSCIV